MVGMDISDWCQKKQNTVKRDARAYLLEVGREKWWK